MPAHTLSEHLSVGETEAAGGHVDATQTRTNISNATLLDLFAPTCHSSASSASMITVYLTLGLIVISVLAELVPAKHMLCQLRVDDPTGSGGGADALPSTSRSEPTSHEPPDQRAEAVGKHDAPDASPIVLTRRNLIILVITLLPGNFSLMQARNVAHEHVPSRCEAGRWSTC